MTTKQYGTVTDPDGMVHDLASGTTTECGQNAASWSREITELQRLGLVLFCPGCASSKKTPQR